MTTPGEPPSYEAAKRQARDPDVSVRRALAEETSIVPELLYYLACDVAAEVRATIAGNPATPLKADLLLAEDVDEGVRLALTGKTAARLPRNGVADPGPLPRLILKILERLGADPSVAVRRALAEAVQELEHAPSDLIRTLAADRDDAVAEPVLLNSPQLADDDLVDLVRAAPAPGTRGAIARRASVSSRVADAIARSDDVGAIAALIANHGAQIREDTLDRILDRAPQEESWHRPLVYRPGLPRFAIARLSGFVALSLVEALQRRSDLDPESLAIVGEMLNARKEQEAARRPPEAEEGQGPDGAERARRLARAGRLTAEDVDDAIFAGDRPFVIAAIAALAAVEESVVDRIFKAASGKATVALAWRAGIGMGLALKLQHQIAHVPARSIVHSREGGGYPLTVGEMEWQLEFFGVEPR